MGSTIKLQDIQKIYRDFSLGPFSIEFPVGKIIGLLGENGAGKTTLLQMILGMLPLDGGSICIMGKDIAVDGDAIKRDIGFVMDECNFHDCLSAKNIAIIMRSIYGNWQDDTFVELLQTLKVPADRPIQKLSKGMKSKLLLAVALSHQPKILILDEITSGLDPVIRDDILDLLQSYQSRGGTILFSSHITSDLEKIADEVVLLHEGQLMLHDTMENLHQKYRMLTVVGNGTSNLHTSHAIRTIKKENATLYLFKKSTGSKEAAMITPTLDDLMLFYCKGALT